MSCKDLGLIEIPKYLSDKKWANPADESRFALIDGLKIHYRDEGNKNAVAIMAIHGIADSLHVWDDLAKNLKQDFRFVRFDIPGFGLSDPYPSRDYSVQNWIKTIYKLSKKLKIKKFHLMGNSLGGYIAWNYALTYPDQTNSLFLIDPAAFPVENAPWVVELARWTPIRQISIATTPRILVSKAIYDVYADDTKVTEKIIDRYYDLMLRNGNRESYMDVFQKILELKSVYPTELVDLKVKTMVVFGEEDLWIPPEQISMWHKEVSHVQTKLYPGVGHTPQSESPELVINDFLNFIKTEHSNSVQ